MIKKHLAQKSRMLFPLVPYYTVLSIFTYSPNFLGFRGERNFEDCNKNQVLSAMFHFFTLVLGVHSVIID